MRETSHSNLTFTTAEKNLKGNTFRYTLDTVIFDKTAFCKHFEHFPGIEIFEIIKFTANHCENV